mgnify:CR=1 FL=1
MKTDSDCGGSGTEDAVGDQEVLVDLRLPGDGGDRDAVVPAFEQTSPNKNIPASAAVDPVAVRDPHVVSHLKIVQTQIGAAVEHQSPGWRIDKRHAGNFNFFTPGEKDQTVWTEIPPRHLIMSIRAQRLRDIISNTEFIRVGKRDAVEIDLPLPADADVAFPDGIDQRHGMRIELPGEGIFEIVVDGVRTAEECSVFQAERDIRTESDGSDPIDSRRDKHCSAAGGGTSVDCLLKGFGLQGERIRFRSVVPDIADSGPFGFPRE